MAWADYTTLLAYGAGIILFFFLIRVLYSPIKVVLRIGYTAIVGALALWAINLVGNVFGFHFPVNLVTALITGYLGVPGLGLIVAVKALVQ
ncbi:MAG TPA: pro-sigmaK processing inhibitor BofA [Firmicutes bacterium]|nr:pro-sigmaK processing inhibitor BofA [Bacillota bacterium]